MMIMDKLVKENRLLVTTNDRENKMQDGGTFTKMTDRLRLLFLIFCHVRDLCCELVKS